MNLPTYRNFKAQADYNEEMQDKLRKEIKTCSICGYPLSISLDGIQRCFKRHKKQGEKRLRYSGRSKFFENGSYQNK